MFDATVKRREIFGYSKRNDEKLIDVGHDDGEEQHRQEKAEAKGTTDAIATTTQQQ